MYSEMLVIHIFIIPMLTILSGPMISFCTLRLDGVHDTLNGTELLTPGAT